MSILHSTAVSFSDAIQYQNGSVVSKTLIDKKIGSITLFSFDAGQGLSEHTSPYDAFVEIFDGKAQITISGKIYSVQAGEFIIMPANQPHSLKAIERFKMMLVMIRDKKDS
ncbi:MAG: cupin domain-containing protein [Candidatus Omnitrophica bacterium]|nr:cupin domain-containing protein [Candidatus Omnitrophota bacterium]